MIKQRKQYEAALKLEVAGLLVDQGLMVAQVLQDMDIGRTAVNRRVEQCRAEQMGKPGIGKPITSEQQRIRELETENRQVRSDNELLKKASAVRDYLNPHPNGLAVFGYGNGLAFAQDHWLGDEPHDACGLGLSGVADSGSQRLG